jgi:hypothetical protein
VRCGLRALRGGGALAAGRYGPATTTSTSASACRATPSLHEGICAPPARGPPLRMVLLIPGGLAVLAVCLAAGPSNPFARENRAVLIPAAPSAAGASANARLDFKRVQQVCAPVSRCVACPKEGASRILTPTPCFTPQDFLRSQVVLHRQASVGARVRQESSDALRMVGLAFKVHNRDQVPTRADRQAERAARKQARQLGLRPESEDEEQDACRPPSVWDDKDKRCRRDLRREMRRKPRACQTPGDMVRKPVCRAYEARRQRRMRIYIGQTRAKILRAKKRASRPNFKYSGMTAKAAQAVFSIKPHHYPHALPKLGDNYIEGYAEDKV